MTYNDHSAVIPCRDSTKAAQLIAHSPNVHHIRILNEIGLQRIKDEEFSVGLLYGLFYPAILQSNRMSVIYDIGDTASVRTSGYETWLYCIRQIIFQSLIHNTLWIREPFDFSLLNGGKVFILKFAIVCLFHCPHRA